MENKQTNEEKNLEMFLELFSTDDGMDIDLKRVYYFTEKKTLSRFLGFITLSNLFVYHIIKSKKGYSLVKDGKKYNFELLSNKIKRRVDKKFLTNNKLRSDNSFFRTLKLASSSNLYNANFILASTKLGISSLIEFQENKEIKIIDYFNNIVMNKNDYEELYELDEISRLDQQTLYRIFVLLDKELVDIDSRYLYLFPNEILNVLNKVGNFNFLYKKFDNVGINQNNYIWMGDLCDSVYFSDHDYDKSQIMAKIEEFTKNPILPVKDFSYSEEDECYYYKHLFSKIPFNLLSDHMIRDEDKKELISDDRYHKCHYMSLELVLSLKESSDIYLINGTIQMNEEDYFYHSWIEIVEDGVTKVYDYTKNLVMQKEDYYKLTGATLINKTTSKDLSKLVELVIDFNLGLDPMDVGYFSQELTRDLEKNKFLLKEKRD